MTVICRIADLITEIPEMGGLAPHLWDYRIDAQENVEVIIDPEKFDSSLYSGRLSYDEIAYMESGRQFFSKLLFHDGFYLHSSSVVYEGRGYLFSADSGTGKSTHTKIWQNTFGEEAKVFNDDKTPLRCIDGRWYAYGAPWCGKDNININMKVPLAGICFMKQAQENKIRRLSKAEAVSRIICQTLHLFKTSKGVDLMLSNVGRLVREIPVFELENRPEPEAALLSYETMRRGAEEAGL